LHVCATTQDHLVQFVRSRGAQWRHVIFAKITWVPHHAHGSFWTAQLILTVARNADISGR